jgi:hypothetical protein
LSFVFNGVCVEAEAGLESLALGSDHRCWAFYYKSKQRSILHWRSGKFVWLRLRELRLGQLGLQSRMHPWNLDWRVLLFSEVGLSSCEFWL